MKRPLYVLIASPTSFTAAGEAKAGLPLFPPFSKRGWRLLVCFWDGQKISDGHIQGSR